jgi:hypothetical protein
LTFLGRSIILPLPRMGVPVIEKELASRGSARPGRFALLAGIVGASIGLAVAAQILRPKLKVPRASSLVPPYQPATAVRLLGLIAEALDRAYKWHTFSTPVGVALLVGLRERLREHNLFDTETLPRAHPLEAPRHSGTRHLIARTPDGSYNDLANPWMGRAGARFGRNVPLELTIPPSETAILTPNPRLVSTKLLARDQFIPATTLNLLAAAWIQFMVHDWFSHGKNQKHNPWKIQLADTDPWPDRPMTILRTHHDPTRPEGSNGPPSFANVATHWWDGSQIYGSDEKTLATLRAGEGGRLAIEPDGFLPLDPTLGVDRTGVNGNYWVGLSLLHTLFVREHNAICDCLRAEFPAWSDDELFDRARLINAAQMAKIHTVEWTPAILGHPTMQYAMRADWWGAGLERIHRILGRIGTSDLEGAPGSATNLYGAPYAMTEEFVAVYRMHPLIPDEFSFRAAADDRSIVSKSFPEVAFRHARETLEQVGFLNAFYSFGTSHPGAITLHNYPRGLRELREPDGTLNDIAATDILRIRERGVPRYNAFREHFHLPRVESFEALTNNPTWAEELREVYNDDVDQVDLMVGLYAEPLPQGFGFSDTAFRVFALMAPRRLTSDRFFTTDYTPRVYTQTGLDWIEGNDFSTILLRHFPDLRPALRQSTNPFAPWTEAKR